MLNSPFVINHNQLTYNFDSFSFSNSNSVLSDSNQNKYIYYWTYKKLFPCPIAVPLTPTIILTQIQSKHPLSIMTTFDKENLAFLKPKIPNTKPPKMITTPAVFWEVPWDHTNQNLIDRCSKVQPGKHKRNQILIWDILPAICQLFLRKLTSKASISLITPLPAKSMQIWTPTKEVSKNRKRLQIYTNRNQSANTNIQIQKTRSHRRKILMKF